jgi:hypothetical protein
VLQWHGFIIYHSTLDHLVTFRIITEECRNDKTDLICCFIDFRKYFDTMPRTNLWNRLEELKVPFELRFVTVRLNEKFIAKFRNIDGCSKEINCNIGVKQGFPLSPTLFDIYIDKLEDFLEDANCVGPTLACIIIILLLYSNDILLYMTTIAWRKCLHTNILELIFITIFNWNYSVEKRINGGGNIIMGLKIIVNQ